MTAPEPERPRVPRIAPLRDDETDEQTGALLEEVRLPNAQAVNIFATLVRHPGLYRRWMPFAGKLLAGKLPARDRELLILRSAWRCASSYEWGQHVRLATQAGISADEIDRVAAGPGAPEWDASDRALLTAVDELHDVATLSAGTWQRLQTILDDAQLLELLLLAGWYRSLSTVITAVELPLETWGAHFPTPTSPPQ